MLQYYQLLQPARHLPAVCHEWCMCEFRMYASLGGRRFFEARRAGGTTNTDANYHRPRSLLEARSRRYVINDYLLCPSLVAFWRFSLWVIMICTGLIAIESGS